LPSAFQRHITALVYIKISQITTLYLAKVIEKKNAASWFSRKIIFWASIHSEIKPRSFFKAKFFSDYMLAV